MSWIAEQNKHLLIDVGRTWGPRLEQIVASEVQALEGRVREKVAELCAGMAPSRATEACECCDACPSQSSRA